jgi:hypothetical protein
VDGIIVECVVALDVGDELVLRAGAQRADRVHVFVDGAVLGEKVPRPERIWVPAVPVGAHAGAEERRGFYQQDIPVSHQHELMRGSAATNPAADYESLFHGMSASAV